MKKTLYLTSASLLIALSACATDEGAVALDTTSPLAASGLDVEDVSSQARAMLNANAKLTAGAGELELTRTTVDASGVGHARFQQSVNGVPVFGGEAIVHIYPNGTFFTSTDDLKRDLDVDTEPLKTLDDATSIAIGLHADILDESPEASLWILQTDDGAALVWKVSLRSLNAEKPSMPVMFIDAHSGELVSSYDNLQTYSLTDSDKTTYDMGGRTRYNRAVVGDSSDSELLTTHDSVASTLDYLSTNYGRDSYDDAGIVVNSYGHYGRSYVNAFWDGRRLTFGDGDGVYSNYLGVLDVTAHEFGHALTEKEANLTYSYESGALNEAASDILAAAVEAYVDGAVTSDTWDVGEDCWLADSALRFMASPSTDGSSYDYYPTRYTGSSDNGGVHWNSGIANHWFYLLSEGGQHHNSAYRSGNTISGIGIDDAYSIWYAALTGYMTSSTNFAGARTATENACSGLGYSSSACDAVSYAWYEVGVGSEPSGGGGGGGDTGTPADDTGTPADDTSTPADDTSTPADDTSTPADDTGSTGGDACPSGYSEILGNLSAGADDQYTYTSSGSGTHDFVLYGPSGSDFDLYLYQYKGRGYKEKASSTTSGADESISYSGSGGDYLIQVDAYSGSGDYTLCYQVPS